jgi:CheY-like chemotaxis protein
VCLCVLRAVALSRARYKVDVANNAEEALDKFKAHPFKIVLMDIQLPGMNGCEATRVIRQLEDQAQTPGPNKSLIFGLTGAVAVRLEQPLTPFTLSTPSPPLLSTA